MSHQTGAIKFQDGTIRYYEYNGTADYPISHHYATPEEVAEHWRNQEWKDCTCGNIEPVMIFADYGGGFYFKGKACKTCLSVESDTGFDVDIIERDETEDWATALGFDNNWCS